MSEELGNGELSTDSIIEKFINATNSITKESIANKTFLINVINMESLLWRLLCRWQLCYALQQDLILRNC